MKNFLRSLITLLLLMVMGGINAEADEVTFAASSDKSSSLSLTKGSITFKATSGTFNNGNNYRVYSSATGTISSSSGNITRIVFTSTTNAYAGNLTLDSNSPGTISTSSKTSTWTGNASSVSFYGIGGQLRFSKIVVTYSGGASGPVAPDITFSPTTIKVNETATLSYPLDLTDIHFTSSDESVAKIEGSTITGLKAGTAKISGSWSGTASYNAGSNKTIGSITVEDLSDAASTFSISPTSISVGKTAQISTTANGLSPTYTSLNENVATVTSAGVVSGVSAGSTTISVSWPATSDYAAGSTALTIIVTAPSTTTDEIIFSNDYKSWNNIGSYSSSTKSYSLPASDGNNYTFTGQNVMNQQGTLQLRNGSGTITSQKFDFDYTVSVEYKSGSRSYSMTLTSGSTTITNSDGNATIDVTAGNSFTISSKSGALQISKITITPKVKVSVAAPTITPATGTYKEAQTVTIKNNADGATVYYTTDGTTPSKANNDGSTTTSKEITVGSNQGVYTISAIAINDKDEESKITTSVITIKHDLTAPVINYDETEHTVTITSTNEDTHYYFTNDGSDVTTTVNGKTELSGTAVLYNGKGFPIHRTIEIKAVAVDKDGCISPSTSRLCKYRGDVTQLPYYEIFKDANNTDLGNFTSETTGSSHPVWEINENKGESAIKQYGEERKYAWVNGNGKTGSARLISPIIDLNGKYKKVIVNFIHAGEYFGDTENDASSFTNKSQKCTLWYRTVADDGTNGEWEQLTIPTWFEETGDNTFPRANSGDIEIPSEALNGKIQVSFNFTSSNEGRNKAGTWNIDQFSVLGTENEQETTEYETVPFLDGYVSYTTVNPIDWAATRQNYIGTDGNPRLRAFKVTQFSLKDNKVVLVEFGAGGVGEQITADGTPVIIWGNPGADEKEAQLVVSKTVSAVKGNLLRPSIDGEVKAGQSQKLFVLQRVKGTDGFHRLATGRTVGKPGQTPVQRKAYLNGVDESDHITTTTNAAKGVYVNFDDVVTDIEKVEPARKTRLNDGIFYNLQGMRVDHPTKGIYIVNGRKVIIK